MSDARPTLEQWLAKGELQRVIDGYAVLAQHYADQERKVAATLQSGRYHHLLEQQRNGTLSQDNYLLERARISQSMAGMVQALPSAWSAEALAQLPSASAYQKPAASKSFLEKWGLILGFVASVMGITGLTLREFLFPKKDPAPVASTVPPSIDSLKMAAKPLQPQPVKPAASREATGQPAANRQPPTNQPTKAPANQLDKVFGAAESMERGRYQGKLAFRNIATGQLLCCYEDAEDFSGGRAYVAQNGRHFYIDKTGRCVEDCR